MMDSEPYFMSNKDWFYYDDEDGITRLTDEGKKNPQVVKSYSEYYADDEYFV